MNSDARAWDERYAGTPQVWSAGPNALAAELLADLPPGRALDLAAGEGRTALWLAARGWDVTALDFSAVGLAKGRERAERDGLAVDWQVADATTADLGRATYDLVVVLYLHLRREAALDVLTRAGEAVRPGGRLLVLGHDRDNLVRGSGGPQDPEVLQDTDLLAAAARAAGLEVVRLEQVERAVEGHVAVDVLFVAGAR